MGVYVSGTIWMDGRRPIVQAAAESSSPPPAATLTWSETNKYSGVTLSNADLTATAGGASFSPHCGRTDTPLAGKVYFEWTPDVISASNNGWLLCGINTAETPTDGTTFFTHGGHAACVDDTGSVTIASTTDAAALGALAVNDVVGVAVDVANALIWFRKGTGDWNGSATADPATGAGGFDISALGATIYPAYEVANVSAVEQLTANFGATTFAHMPPSGFSAP